MPIRRPYNSASLPKPTNELIVMGQPPSEDDEFYIAWGRETLKNSIVFINEVLRQLVTLDVSLLGGSIVFLDDKLVGPTFKRVTIVFFFLSLIISFVGMMPYHYSVDIRMPEKIRQHKLAAFKWKRFCLWSAGVLLAAGFVTALIGLLLT